MFNCMMHPRSIFKTNPPDFKRLAKQYPGFKIVCYIGVGGKVCIDFKNPEAVKALTETLLLDYFGLEVEIPRGSLVPRVPNRLNYILLLQDLLQCNSLDKDVEGIDIGIFPLLGSRLNGWRFYATDTDITSLNYAKANVKRNSLDEKIRVIHSNPDDIFLSVMSLQQTIDQFSFSMCNPPFFDPDEGDQRFHTAPNTTYSKNVQNRFMKSGKSLPRSATEAKCNEVFFSGGETSFATTIIEESITYKHRVKIFTTMIGRQSSISPLLKLLLSLDSNVTTSTYALSQGRIQHWVIAWTFDSSLVLPSFHYSGSSVRSLQGEESMQK